MPVIAGVRFKVKDMHSMKKVVFIIYASLFLSSCSDNENEKIKNLTTSQVQSKSATIKTMKDAVKINSQIISVEDGRIIVRGTTNLPDTTSLLISLENKELGFGAQDKPIVLNGYFSTAPLGKKTGLPVGNYTVEIIMPLPSTQSKTVQEIIGKQGQHLSGPLVKDTSWGGRIVEKTIKHVIGSPQAIATLETNHKQLIDNVTKNISTLLKLGQAMESLRNTNDLSKLRLCGEQMRVNQTKATSLREASEKLPLKYIHLKVSVIESYSCVSCSKNAINACDRATESLKQQQGI
jgi:PBP1b-binding outer membrane lipoprotein LpoB